jgi:Raf kinase inhibitor-like YbhB/YbcL family protein
MGPGKAGTIFSAFSIKFMHYLIISSAFTAMMSMVSVANAQLTVTSKSFADNGSIPLKYSCEGEQVSPPLQVSNVPAGAKSLALILHDPDAARPGGFTHWVAWNIDTNGDMPEGFKGGEQGHSGAGKPGYIGMCPPSGTHHYHFMVYALDTKLNLDITSDKAALEKAMEGHILAKGELVGLYKKEKP